MGNAKEGKICVFECCSVPVLTNGMETGTLTRADTSRLMAAEVRFVRSIKGKSRRGRITDKKTRKFKDKNLGRPPDMEGSYEYIE
jgi:hypothetical protein